MYIEKSGLHLKIAVLKWFKIKMGQRSVPIFVNLKSNTMKNTMQRYSENQIFASFFERIFCFARYC